MGNFVVYEIGKVNKSKASSVCELCDKKKFGVNRFLFLNQFQVV